MTDAAPLLQVRDLKTHFTFRAPSTGVLPGPKRILKAVDGVSFDLAEGEVLGIVGESGCGKSTVGRTLTKLEPATSGEARFRGRDILGLSAGAFRPLRREIQMIFQDPFASLNPRLTIEQTLAEPVRIHGLARTREEVRAPHRRHTGEGRPRSEGDDPLPARVLRRPAPAHRHRKGDDRRTAPRHRRRGGLRARRVDPGAGAQPHQGPAARQRHLDAVHFHDLGVVRHISDRVAVMYLGRIVETAPKAAIFEKPAHPYTRLLLASIPRIRPGRQPVADLGEPASAASPPSGCAFHPRCPLATDICRSTRPDPVDLGNGRSSACHHAGQLLGEAA